MRTLIPFCALAGLLLFSAGCALHSTPPTDPPFTLDQAYQGDAEIAENRWWSGYRSEPLEQILNDAFAGNFSIREALARLNRFDAISGSAAAGRLPKVQAGAQASHDRSPGLTKDSESDSLRGSLSLSWELDLWQRVRSLRDAARLESEATRDDLNALYLVTASTIIDTWFQLGANRAQQSLAAERIARLQRLVDFTDYRYRQGQAVLTDLYAAEENLLAARRAEQTLIVAGTRLTNALAVLCGRPPGSYADLQPLLPVPLEVEGLPARVIGQRPDVRAALARVYTADARVGAAIADRFPQLTLTAATGYSRSDNGTNVISGSFWNLVGGLSLPLFDGGYRRQEVKRNEALFDEALQRYHLSLLTAVREIEDALAGNAAANQSYRFSLKSLEIAGANEELVRLQYEQGQVGYPVLIQAELKRLNAHDQLIGAQRSLLAEENTLGRASGGSWPESEIANLQVASEIEATEATGGKAP